MCLATPVKVVELNKSKAIVDAAGGEKEVDVSLLSDVKVGDYLYINRSLAIKKVSRSDAKRVLELIRSWNAKSA
ncbi:MAG: hypothetical protein A2Z42_01035 [Candidatus Woykebacteria bacterium RBG_19FT_COMBO_43_10]|uniref:Hydrogenase assembly protein HupF n=1 Tax=Candidatus Woykebacteria bacterium RBG_19FT_COMBO_43_10 TaxID=1802598 RepID=A0A1G1WKW9_9BACT|nr:MAG: hypothetical protein A2Z42_01035 [Candidatus Woykebacteria bacterium RBG_19FT_COMBO_43_10]